MDAITIDKAREAILYLIAFILSITVHEFGHAWVADRLGDPLPRADGRVTLSPAAHIDPIGTILMPLLVVLLPGGMPLLAWGKPVRTQPFAYTRRVSMRTGHILVSAAGPAMNIVLAGLVSLLVVALGKTGVLNQELALALVKHLLILNVFLFFFNLLPVPPLDGGHVLANLFPRSPVVEALQRWGWVVLLLLIVTPVLGILMRPAGMIAFAWARGLLTFVYA